MRIVVHLSHSMASSVEELAQINPNWDANGLTWNVFGSSPEEMVNRLALKWFTDDPVTQMKFYDIWNRHPLRLTGKWSYHCFIAINF